MAGVSCKIDWGAKGPSNYHTHTRWCDGSCSAREMVEAALAAGFKELGFSSHAMFPLSLDGYLSPERAADYAREIGSLKAEFADRISIRLGVEADFVKGVASPDRAVYAGMGVEYVIGSIHFVMPPGAVALEDAVAVDMSPENLREGIDRAYGGDVRSYVHDYFAQEREMALNCDFDIVGHPDLVRKFNGRMKLFDEDADWYLGEIEATADAIARSGRIAEVNTGAISRGWMSDAYPSSLFRELLKSRGVRMILSSDAHAAGAIDCAFDRFKGAV